MITKAASELEEGDVFRYGNSRVTARGVVKDAFNVTVYLDEERSVTYSPTQPVTVYNEAPPKPVRLSNDALYIRELEDRLRRRERTIAELRCFVEMAASGNTEADHLEVRAKIILRQYFS